MAHSTSPPERRSLRRDSGPGPGPSPARRGSQSPPGLSPMRRAVPRGAHASLGGCPPPPPPKRMAGRRSFRGSPENQPTEGWPQTKDTPGTAKSTCWVMVETVKIASLILHEIWNPPKQGLSVEFPVAGFLDRTRTTLGCHSPFSYLCYNLLYGGGPGY